MTDFVLSPFLVVPISASAFPSCCPTKEEVVSLSSSVTPPLSPTLVDVRVSLVEFLNWGINRDGRQSIILNQDSSYRQLVFEHHDIYLHVAVSFGIIRDLPICSAEIGQGLSRWQASISHHP